MKGLFGKVIPAAALALIGLSAVFFGAGQAHASSYVTLMTPIGTDTLVINGVKVGTFPVYNGQAKLTFSWTRYWAPYWPSYPNPAPANHGYKVALWQNTTPLAATPTWTQLHTSHHPIDDPNPTRFTFDTFMETENLCQDCPSMVVVQPETIQRIVDAGGNTTFNYIPATASNSGVPALMKSDLFLVKGFTLWKDAKNPPCPFPPKYAFLCAF